MDYIRVAPVGGLFHEFYNPTPNGFSIFDLNIKENELDSTNLFWSIIFDIANIKQIVDKITPDSPKYIAVAANTELFIQQVENAKKNICNPDLEPKEFFEYLETLSIVCSIYSKYVYAPHRLTIQNGFETDNFSASQIYNNCLDSKANPYLLFIKRYVMPQIRTLLPQVIFIDGMPTYYNMAICSLVKKEFPNTHVCLTRHSSEYYSLNKLEKHLSQNEYLFKMIDSVVLEYFDETEKQLLYALKNNKPLSTVSNLIYKNNDEIHANPYKVYKKDYTPVIQEQYPLSKLVNIHLQPYSMCYWNKCTFCGINRKYHNNNNDESLDTLNVSLDDLKKRIHTGVKYIWFIDEAIHPIKLKYIANYFIKNKLEVLWQVRCRIEELLLDEELIVLLQKSGLKELRLGLESASLNVLKTMNKFDDDFSFERVDRICDAYTSAGISIHFPMIIGFPGESSFDRKKTYDYLQHLCQKYPLVTFNINVFNLDISSDVFNHPNKYGIEDIYYPCPLQDFLGNNLKWKRNDDIQEKDLLRERDQYMREILYPWMPVNAFIKPYLFYRLSETVRNTLILKCHNDSTISSNKELLLNSQIKVLVPDTLVYSFDLKRNVYIIYNWKTHHYMIGNSHLIFVLDLFKEARPISNAINILVTYNPTIYIAADLEILLLKLYQQEYLIELNGKED